jgi:protein phosphatase
VTALDEECLLIAVSDGLGGHPGGDAAAHIIIDCLESIEVSSDNKTALLEESIDLADEIIRGRVESSPNMLGMGATATAAIFSNGTSCWAHIGDSRLYLLRNGILGQITRDHSFLQDLIDGGDISTDEAANHPLRHVLDQCVGCIDSGVETGQFETQSGDIFLACTDGLCKEVSDRKIANILTSTDNIFKSADHLIQIASQPENNDDITVSLVLIS